MKVVINACFGGFSISKDACNYLGIEEAHAYNPMARTDPRLVECVEKLGKRANGRHAELKIVDVPDDIDWYIDEYDGAETVREKHRTWE